MTDRELMQLALEALKRYRTETPLGHQPHMIAEDADKAITALRERLAQPEQELVCVCGAIWEGQELVSAPPQRQWQGLTADEIWKCNAASSGSAVEYHICMAHQNVEDFAEAIEAKLKEKNA